VSGAELGRNGIGLAGNISAHMYLAVINAGADDATLFRTVSQTIQGIRAGAANQGLEANQVRGQIERSLVSIAPPPPTTLGDISDIYDPTASPS
jgi:hypothetical protein